MNTKDCNPADRRLFPRVELDDSVGGEVRAIVASSIINISATGTLVELPCRLNPGGLYEIRMTFAGRVVTTLAEVVRSYVHALGVSNEGSSTLLYRAGLCFRDLDPEDAEYLRVFVEDCLARARKSSAQAV